MSGTFDKVEVVRSDKGTKTVADVLHKTDKSMKVVLVGTTITINMSRTDLTKHYVGRAHNMEFTSNGESV